MSVRFAFCDVQIRSFQTGFHKGRTGCRHPDVVHFGLFNAAVKYFHDAFVCCFWSTRNPPGENDDFAFGTMSTDLLHENSHGSWKIRVSQVWQSADVLTKPRRICSHPLVPIQCTQLDSETVLV